MFKQITNDIPCTESVFVGLIDELPHSATHFHIQRYHANLVYLGSEHDFYRRN